MSNVVVQEALSIRVGKFCAEATRFALASCTGLAVRELVKSDWVGILYQDPKLKPEKHLFGLITTQPRRIFLGTVWLSNTVRRADEKNWVFEVHGREYLEMAEDLARELSSTFQVKVNVVLVDEQPQFEARLSDYDE